MLSGEQKNTDTALLLLSQGRRRAQQMTYVVSSSMSMTDVRKPSSHLTESCDMWGFPEARGWLYNAPFGSQYFWGKLQVGKSILVSLRELFTRA